MVLFSKRFRTKATVTELDSPRARRRRRRRGEVRVRRNGVTSRHILEHLEAFLDATLPASADLPEEAPLHCLLPGMGGTSQRVERKVEAHPGPVGLHLELISVKVKRANILTGNRKACLSLVNDGPNEKIVLVHCQVVANHTHVQSHSVLYTKLIAFIVSLLSKITTFV